MQSVGEDIAAWLLRLTHLHCQAQVHLCLRGLRRFMYLSFEFSLALFGALFVTQLNVTETIFTFVDALTPFYFQGLTKIADLSVCSNITVLYLYSNKITRIGKIYC